MATVQMPKTIPCQFDKKGWRPCKRPTNNGWCDGHQNAKCSSCGEQAHRSCDSGIGGLACGANLCETCKHNPEGGGHVTREKYQEYLATREMEEEAKEASRKCTTPRMNEELGVPLNLFELMKNEEHGFTYTKVYFLELEHGLMGTFPALLNDSKDVIITPDKSALELVLNKLPRRPSKVNHRPAYVHLEKSIVYIELGSSQYELEGSEPLPLFSREAIERLIEEHKEPFKWARGLVDTRTGEGLGEALGAVAQECGIE